MSDAQSSTVGTWALAPCQEHPAESSFTTGLSSEGNETSLPDDSRVLVDEQDIRPGGKYYSVVKLQIRYEKQEAADTRWAQGSGWLVSSSLLITAGHCAFDHANGLGRATHVKVYVGYSGKDSVKHPNVQFRHGAQVMTTSGWLSSDVNRQNDVSFIVVDKAFDNIKPINWQSTPTRGTKVIGVVGYPADKSYKDELAARMYVQYKKVTFDLDAATMNMLQYTISSYGGQSGSPVIVQDENTAIGTHVYGLGDKNSASVIRGKYGNFYCSYITALSRNIAAPEAGTPWRVLNLPAAEDALTETARTDAESFWDVFKKVVNVGASVGSSVLSVATPFLGPVGTPIAAVAGGALGVISKVTGESSLTNEANTITPSTHKHHMCRGILAEGALQAVLDMHPETAAKYGIYQHMEKRFLEHKQHIPALARAIGPSLMGPAVRIALDSTVPKPSTTIYPALPKPTGTESAFEPGQDSWVNLVTANHQTHPETEGFFDFVKKAIDIGTKVAPIAISAAGGIINAVKGESALEPAETDLQPHFETLCHRALMADAALEAMMRIPAKEVQQEGFLDSVVSTFKSIGSTVLKVAPSVLRVVEPIAHQLIQQKLNPGKGESSFTGARRPLRSTKSTYDLLKDDSSTMPELPKINPAFSGSIIGASNSHSGFGSNANGFFKSALPVVY